MVVMLFQISPGQLRVMHCLTERSGVRSTGSSAASKRIPPSDDITDGCLLTEGGVVSRRMAFSWRLDLGQDHVRLADLGGEVRLAGNRASKRRKHERLFSGHLSGTFRRRGPTSGGVGAELVSRGGGDFAGSLGEGDTAVVLAGVVC